MEINEFVDTLENALKNGCRFCSFMYRAKGTGETAIYTVNLGIDLLTAYKRDRNVLANLKLNGLSDIARNELVASLDDSLTHGLGANKNYTAKGAFKFLGKGARLHLADNQLHLTGYLINKKVVQEGQYKKINSSPKTLAKIALGKKMKCRKFRDFIFDPRHIAGLKINNRVLEIQNT